MLYLIFYFEEIKIAIGRNVDMYYYNNDYNDSVNKIYDEIFAKNSFRLQKLVEG